MGLLRLQTKACSMRGDFHTSLTTACLAAFKPLPLSRINAVMSQMRKATKRHKNTERWILKGAFIYIHTLYIRSQSYRHTDIFGQDCGLCGVITLTVTPPAALRCFVRHVEHARLRFPSVSSFASRGTLEGFPHPAPSHLDQHAAHKSILELQE